MPWVEDLISSCQQLRAKCQEQLARFEAGEDKLLHNGEDESALEMEHLRKTLVSFDRMIGLITTALLSSHSPQSGQFIVKPSDEDSHL